MKKSFWYIFALFLLVTSVLLFFCNNLNNLLYIPVTTPLEWCESQPCIELAFGSLTLIIIQPSSTVFVYLLGFLAITIGIDLMEKKSTQSFKSWWGIALILWGIGAILAGTSYQAFSYEIKCAGKPFCMWTSLWEIFYLIFSVGSVNAMLVAQSRLNDERKEAKIMEGYAFGNFIAYIFVVVIGSIIPSQFMISFEMMILFLVPTILFLLIFNIRRYRLQKDSIYLSLVYIWIFLILIIGIYFLYYILGVTEILWEMGFWFSANDVLHIGLISWMIYIYFSIKNFNNLSVKSSSSI